MDEGESKKKQPSLPPDYVSLAQLQERWFKKKQEKELKEEEKTENFQNLKRIENLKMEKERGIVEEQSIKGKKKKKNKRRKNKPSLIDGEKKNPRSENGEIDRKGEGEGEGKGVEIISNNGSKMGAHESVSVVNGLPRNEVREEVPNVKTVGFEGGFRRNGDNRAAGCKLKEYRVKVKHNEAEISTVKVGGEKGNGAVRSKNGNNRNRDSRLKKCKAKMNGLMGNEVELNHENVPNDEILDVCNKMDCLTDEGLSDKIHDEDSVVENARTGENVELRNGFRRYVDRKGNAGISFGGRLVLKGNEVELNSKNVTEDEILVVGRKIKDSVMDKENTGEKLEGENDFRRENTGRNFSGRFAFGDVRAGCVRNRVKMNVGERRYESSSGKFNGGKDKQRNSGGMVWVKKDEKKGANASEIGISPDEQ